MAQISLLQGSCACERNQYQIELPLASMSAASVFFDNSAQSRRPQASPVTAWLRIPLDYYHSATIAQFPDETHTSIRRTYTTKYHPSTSRTTRRQFCGYCGTHLTAYDESQSNDAELIDVTLGSLQDDSLDRLEELGVFQNTDEEEDDTPPSEGLVRGGIVDEDTRIASTASQEQATESIPPLRNTISRHMQHRGMPYFEEMIQNSSLGRIKRQKGGHVSDDGRTKVHWEIVEYDEGDQQMLDAAPAEASSPAKRVKLGA